MVSANCGILPRMATARTKFLATVILSAVVLVALVAVAHFVRSRRVGCYDPDTSTVRDPNPDYLYLNYLDGPIAYDGHGGQKKVPLCH